MEWKGWEVLAWNKKYNNKINPKALKNNNNNKINLKAKQTKKYRNKINPKAKQKNTTIKLIQKQEKKGSKEMDF